jgi:hypothetical protein
MPGPKLENLLTEYVDTIPVFPITITSGNSAFGYFLQKHKFTDISLFNNERFTSKIREVARSSVESDALWALANRVNIKAQADFEKAHPV